VLLGSGDACCIHARSLLLGRTHHLAVPLDWMTCRHVTC
jgi:hypothetical protein